METDANVYLQSFLWIFVNEAIGEAAKANITRPDFVKWMGNVALNRVREK